jgi:hypothetical protein
MGIGSPSIFSGEIYDFVGTGERFALLYFYDDGAEISAENEAG